MDSKNAILILGLLAMVLLISSEVSARDLTETSSDAKKEVVEKTNEVNDAKYGGGGNYHNGGGHYYGGGSHHGGGGSHHGGGGSHHGGGGCHYYCHGHCCSYAEFVAVQTEEKTNEVNDAKYGGGGYHNGGGNYHNGGGHYYGGGSHGGGGSHHGGGGCHYYCHGHCCSHAEFVAVQAEDKTQN